MGQFFKGMGKKFQKLRTVETKFKCKIRYQCSCLTIKQTRNYRSNKTRLLL